MELANRSNRWQGRNNTRGGGGSHLGYRTQTSVSGRVGPRNVGTGGDTNGPGPNSRLEGVGRNKIGQRDRGTKHLAYQDLLDRRQRGLCYKCGGPYGPLHQCPVKQLRLILVDDELQVEYERDDNKVEQLKEEDKSELEGECSSICLHRLEKERNHPLNTMKLRGQVRGIPLFVLVDSGATHNFISKKLVDVMGWSQESTKRMKILMGDGHKSETSGVCRGLRVETTVGEFTVDAFLFELGDIDMILGMSWLVSLGEMVVDWNKQRMKIVTPHGTKVLEGALRGEPLLASLSETIPKDEQIGGVELKQEQQEALNEVLKRFRDVFVEPKGLPPIRAKEHAIILKAGQEPINVRLYRYPYHQKNEIEHQVRELLTNGHIRHSQSEYSSPVILVKKKKNQWRMCVNYRAPNKATILDKFPIPVIEELPDELHGASFFSKLDLKSGYHQVRMRREDIPKTAFRTLDCDDHTMYGSRT
uniref:Retrovirus-related Pol polyprotein from transposon opus n=1 Tax=Cajanus cajan TaxID=3821 RepID=A0A151SZ85_CAJCA|nr:Retrovirus-related Pol polyprotein from transposon opus [Cajanus cajan]